MRFLSCLREGVRIAGRHKRLIVPLWLAPLIPAAVLAAMAASNVVPNLGRSLFSEGVLRGDWFVVWSEFRSSPLDALDPLLGPGVVLLAAAAFLVHVVLAAGVVEVVLERRSEHPFVLGVRSNLLRFARTAVLLVVGTVLAGLAAGAVMRAFFSLAESRADGRLDLVGVAAGVAVFVLLWAPQKLAADLSRIAAAEHGERSMTRGYLRALGAVLLRPGLFVPLALAFAVAVIALHVVYALLRSPWTPASMGAVVGLLLLQQLVMLVRAAFRLGFWGTEAAAFRAVGAPRWCRPRTRRERVPPAPATRETDVVVEGGAGI